MSILIIDNGLCNLDSIRRAVEECGHSVSVRDQPENGSEFSKIILPGVGNFTAAMKRLRETGYESFIRTQVLEQKVPFLGICLGMQLMATQGSEGGETGGLGLIPGRVEALRAQTAEERVPHMGWNDLQLAHESQLFTGIERDRDFYFVHSFRFQPDSPSHILARTDYCGGFVSAVERENIFGVQFHPEKSQQAGLRLLKNFLEI